MTSPHILFVTQHYPPEVAATGQLLSELAEDLVGQGFQVTVLAGRPMYDVAGANGRMPNREHRNGVDVVRTLSTSFSRRAILGRAANWISYSLSSLVWGATGVPRPDVVVGYSAPPTVLTVAYLLAKRWGAKLVLYMQDIYPDIARAVGAMKDGLLFGAWRSLNHFIYKRADAILTLGDYMAARLAQEDAPPERIAVVHNWADGERLYAVPHEQNPLRQILGLGERFIVLYSGNLGMAHDFGPVRKAIDGLRHHRDRLAFLFVGGGARRPEMETFVQQNRFEDFVIFRDYMPQDDLLSSLNIGDATLLTVLNGTEGLVAPSKLYGYMAVGRPILAVCSAPCEASDIVEGDSCGFVVRTGEELAAAILDLFENPDMRSEMGRRSRAALEDRFERRIATARIGDLFRSLIRESAHA